MDERKKLVLNAIIQDYIVNAEPVGSRSVARKYDLGVSPATIRNEMSDLEELGYIEQPHTSAGRIPSHKGYRYYVDYLMQKEQLLPTDMEMIRAQLADRLAETDQFVRDCCRLLSRLTDYPALIAMPPKTKGRLLRLQLIPVSDYRLMLILLSDTGKLQHKMIDLPQRLSPDEVAYIEETLTERLAGVHMAQLNTIFIERMLRELHLQERIYSQTLSMLEDFLSPPAEQQIFTGGAMNMLKQPEFRDVDKLRGIFELLEEDDQVKEIMALPEDSRDVLVAIGNELGNASLQNCSIIFANYFINGERAGTIGVLGPTRMSYGKTVSLIEFLATEISARLSHK